MVVYWSKAFCERERQENKSFLDFIEKIESQSRQFPDHVRTEPIPEKIPKKEMINKETGEITDAKKLLAMIDDEKR